MWIRDFFTKRNRSRRASTRIKTTYAPHQRTLPLRLEWLEPRMLLSGGASVAQSLLPPDDDPFASTGGVLPPAYVEYERAAGDVADPGPEVDDQVVPQSYAPVQVRIEQPTSTTQPTVIALEPPWLSSVPQVIPGQVYVGIWTDTAVSDMEAYVQTLEWPETIGPLTSDSVWVGTTRPFSEGGFRTGAVLPLQTDVDLTHGVEDLEKLSWVLWAEPDRVLQTEDASRIGPTLALSAADVIGDQRIVQGILPDWIKEDGSSGRVIPGQVYVGMWTDTPVSDMKAYVQTFNWPDAIATLTPANVWVGGTWPFSEGGFRTGAVLPLRSDVQVMDVVEDLERLNGVLWAEPERILAVEQFIPDDPFYDPPPPNPPMYHHTIMDNPHAWETTLGDAGIEIAVIDQGVDIDHEDLAANIDLANAWDFVDNDNDPSPAAGEHHGTYVAGIAAAVTNNATGVAGVAGGSSIMPLRVYTAAQRNDAIQYAVDNGADIINTSVGVTQEDVDSVPYNEALNYAYARGVLHINSAGNDDELNPARQKLHQTLYVAATDWNDAKAGFSNYGTGIDISAPGRSRDVNDPPTDPAIISTFNDDAYAYYYIGGTSYAAPSGLKTRLSARFPGLTPWAIFCRPFGTGTKGKLGTTE